MTWPQRFIVIGVAIGLGSINGLEHSGGVLDFVAGLMLIVALFAPKHPYTEAREQMQRERREATWDEIGRQGRDES